MRVRNQGLRVRRDKVASMPAKRLANSGTAAAQFGCIATLREQTTDERRVIHRKGKGTMEQVAEYCDHHEGDWRVLSISTPETVYRDLQGTRMRIWGDGLDWAEVAMLGSIGRLDLLDPFFDTRLPRGGSRHM